MKIKDFPSCWGEHSAWSRRFPLARNCLGLSVSNTLEGGSRTKHPGNHGYSFLMSALQGSRVLQRKGPASRLVYKKPRCPKPESFCHWHNGLCGQTHFLVQKITCPVPSGIKSMMIHLAFPIFSGLASLWQVQSRGHERVSPGKAVNTSQDKSLGANTYSRALGRPISTQQSFTTFLGGKTQWLSRLLFHLLHPACSLTSAPAPGWGWQTGDTPQRLGGSECLWGPWERIQREGQKRALTLLSLDAPWCDDIHLAPSKPSLPSDQQDAKMHTLIWEDWPHYKQGDRYPIQPALVTLQSPTHDGVSCPPSPLQFEACSVLAPDWGLPGVI